MNPSRRAVIDVGTNSVKLLVADVAGREVHPVREESRQTRLGKGFYESHRLQPAAIAQTTTVVAAFAAGARAAGAEVVRVIATSAARDAQNRDALTTALEAASGLPVEVISGDLEAEWAFRGVTTDPQLARVPLLLLDAGGGSTEFILGCGEAMHFRSSFALGTVRLMERIPHSDPPTTVELAAVRSWLSQFLGDEVLPRLAGALRREAELRVPTRDDPTPGRLELVGTGGTATILARMALAMEGFDRERIESVRLGRAEVQETVARLWRLPLAERRQLPGLPSNRADVILTGAAIYEAVMECLDFDRLRISTRGLRFAAVMETPRSGASRPAGAATASP